MSKQRGNQKPPRGATRGGQQTRKSSGGGSRGDSKSHTIPTTQTQWACPCGVENWANRKTCRGCRACKAVDLAATDRDAKCKFCHKCGNKPEECVCSRVKCDWCNYTLDGCQCDEICKKCQFKYRFCSCWSARCGGCCRSFDDCVCNGRDDWCEDCKFRICRCDFPLQDLQLDPDDYADVIADPTEQWAHAVPLDIPSAASCFGVAEPFVDAPLQFIRIRNPDGSWTSEGITQSEFKSAWSLRVNSFLFKKKKTAEVEVVPGWHPDAVGNTPKCVVTTILKPRFGVLDVSPQIYVEKPLHFTLTWHDWPIRETCSKVLFGAESDYVIREKPTMTFGVSRVIETFLGLSATVFTFYTSGLMLRTALYVIAGLCKPIVGLAVLPTAAINPVAMAMQTITTMTIMNSFTATRQITWHRAEEVVDEQRHPKYDTDTVRPSETYVYNRREQLKVIWNGYCMVDIRVPLFVDHGRKRVINKDLLQVCLNSRVCNPLQTTEVAHRRLTELVNSNPNVAHNFTGIITQNHEPYRDTVDTAIGILGDLKGQQGVGATNTGIELMRYRSPIHPYPNMASPYSIGVASLIVVGVVRSCGPTLVQLLMDLFARFPIPPMELPHLPERLPELVQGFQSSWEGVKYLGVYQPFFLPPLPLQVLRGRLVEGAYQTLSGSDIISIMMHIIRLKVMSMLTLVI